mgnify:CR=1 FL=1
MQAGNAVGKSYTSSFDGLRKIVAAEGPQGLYKGIGPKLTQSVATVRPLFLARGLAAREEVCAGEARAGLTRSFLHDAGCAPLPRQGEDLPRHAQGASSSYSSRSSRSQRSVRGGRGDRALTLSPDAACRRPSSRPPPRPPPSPARPTYRGSEPSSRGGRRARSR